MISPIEKFMVKVQDNFRKLLSQLAVEMIKVGHISIVLQGME